MTPEELNQLRIQLILAKAALTNLELDASKLQRFSLRYRIQSIRSQIDNALEIVLPNPERV